jgi:ATP-dependent 26S proteasome regulatory subunit
MSRQQVAANREVLNAERFKEEIGKLSDACIGVFLIRTKEQFRCQEVLQDWAISNEMDFQVWSIQTGWAKYPMPPSDETTAANVDISKPISMDRNTIDPNLALDCLKEEGRVSPKACLVMLNLQYAFNEPSIQQHIKDHVGRAMDQTQRLFLIVPESTEIPSSIEDDVTVVDFLPPSYAELLQFWEDTIASMKPDIRPKFDEDEVDQIIQNSLGMSLLEFDTAISIGFVEAREDLSEKKRVSADRLVKVILRHKTDIIKKTDLLELVDPVPINQVGGLDLLKKYVEKRTKCFTPQAREEKIDPPKGIIIVGPPGGGKSLIAKAVAAVMKVPCVRFDIGKVFGHLVGMSEERMRKALKTVEAMAPCVLFMDEIDKAFGGMNGGGGDGGTTQRVFGTFLTWQQERSKEGSPIFCVMTANNIDGLPPELMRKGRVDEIFAVTFPSDAERLEILKIHLALRGRGKDLTPEQMKAVIKETTNFVGSEIEAIVKDANVERFHMDMPKLTTELLIEQARNIIPISKAFEGPVKRMNEWAKLNARKASSTMSFDLPETEAKGGDKVVNRSPSLRRRFGKPARPTKGASDN